MTTWMGWSPVSVLDRSVYPRADRPDEVRAADLILSMRRSGTSIRGIVQSLNDLHLPGARSGRWNPRLVGNVIRRAGGKRRFR
jgi:hypothetical protein